MFMLGWIVQVTSKVPALSNVTVTLWPESTFLSKAALSAALPSLPFVTVCSVGSMFTNVTVVPTGTVRVVGSNAKFISITFVSPAPEPPEPDPAAVCVEVAWVALEVVLAPAEHATRTRLRAMVATPRRKCDRRAWVESVKFTSAPMSCWSAGWYGRGFGATRILARLRSRAHLTHLGAGRIVAPPTFRASSVEHAADHHLRRAPRGPR
jgi:hypothetical protein